MDILHESEEGAESLIDALAEAECASLLLHNLARLDEQVADERDAVHNTLGMVKLHTTMLFCNLVILDFYNMSEIKYISLLFISL